MNIKLSFKKSGFSDMAQLIVFATLISFVAAFRLVDHAPNFAPVAAMGLVAGYMFRSRLYGIVAVVLAMVVSDVVIGFDSLEMRFVVYGSLLLPVLMGFFLKSKSGVSLGSGVFGASLLGSALFFVFTNLAVWAFSGMYEHTASGLMLCYAYALPFFQNTIAGDLLFSGAFFTSVYLWRQISTSPELARG
mgnify:CR=1 FL=1